MNDEIQKFIGSEEYEAHKQKRFPNADLTLPIREQEAFLLKSPENRQKYKLRYEKTAGLYYRGQPSFEEVLEIIHKNIDRL